MIRLRGHRLIPINERDSTMSMSISARRGVAAASALAVASLGVAVVATPAQAAYRYDEIPQSQMKAVWTDSVETSGEGANGPLAKVLDNDTSTYWHTKWSGGAKDPLPHSFIIKLGDQAKDNVGRVVLTPRQSSNGSGRVHNYEIGTSEDPNCGKDTEFTAQTTGEVPESDKLQDTTIDFGPVKAACIKVVYTSAWGGSPGSTEEVASLAEFRAYTRSGEADPPAPPATPLTPREVDGKLTLHNDTLSVDLDPKFPQVVAYKLGDKTVLGSLRDPLKSIQIDEKDQKVTVGKVATTATTATYPLTLPDLGNATMNAVFTLKGQTLTFTLKDIKDPESKIHRIRIPNQDIVTLDAAVKGSQISAQEVSVNRASSGDRFEPVATQKADEKEKASHRILANTDAVGIAFSGNGVEDTTAGGTSANRAYMDNARWSRSYRNESGRVVGSISEGTWVHRGTSATTIGADPDPYWTVKLTGDANADKKVDWQDAAIAFRDIRPHVNGQDDVPNKVVTRIPFNIVSQAAYPFLRTLDDTKRVALATDGLGQQVMLKGYQAEGHDSAHPDYADHYNTRAGGFEDLKTLVNEGNKWNASFGVHVNDTESYSEAKSFSEDLIQMPPQPGWGWMNQAYYIDQGKDLGTGAVLKRFQDFKDEVPANLNWLYIDVFQTSGWIGQRLGAELQKQGWVMGTEYSPYFPDATVWTHWSQDEHYGGTNNKGWNSQIFRFEENSYRDEFNPDPVLGMSTFVAFEGWQSHHNYGAFLDSIWQRNLPAKFLQRSPVMTLTDKSATFQNGTAVTLNGTDEKSRDITFDGAKVYANGGSYLLPWKDGGTATSKDDGRDRLYHYNPDGGDSTWTLTNTWKTQKSLTLYKLTDTGRVKVADVPVTDGKITLKGIEAKTAYVLYPTSKLPATVAPDWGQGSHIADPGFFSGTLDAYQTTGKVTTQTNDNKDTYAVIGGGEAGSISQQLALPAGTWSAWAWVQIEPGKARTTTVSASGDGVKPTTYQQVKDGVPTTTITASTTPNGTGSDSKYGTNFQRVRVTFTSTGKAVTLKVAAAKGEGAVSVDDFRVVKWTDTPAPKTSRAAGKVVYYQDFEHVDTGYWPFVTGTADGAGDARTQLAERHEPYSQKGWYGKNTQGVVVKGGKLIDNVLDGHWSLLAHEEGQGIILRTTEASLPKFAPNHKYRISFAYQTAFADAYQVSLKSAKAAGWRTSTARLATEKLGEHHDTATYSTEFVTGPGYRPYVEISKLSGGAQNDLTIDNFMVEDLGATDEEPTPDLDAGGPELKNPVDCHTLKLESVDSEELVGEAKPNGPGAMALDCNDNTFWHTQWQDAQPGYPHEIVVSLPEDKDWTVTGFEYTPRQNGKNSRVKDFEIYVSADGKDWGAPVFKGSLKDGTAIQAFNFDEGHKGRFIKMVQLNAQPTAEAPFGGAAEIRVGATYPGQPEPNPDEPVNPNPDQPVNPNPDEPVNPNPDEPVNPNPDQPVNPNNPGTNPSTKAPVEPSTKPASHQSKAKPAKQSASKLAHTGATAGMVGALAALCLAGGAVTLGARRRVK